MKDLFLRCVQVAVIISALQSHNRHHFWAACVMAAAVAVPEGALPEGDTLTTTLMALDFIEWQCDGAAQPDWYNTDWAAKAGDADGERFN